MRVVLVTGKGGVGKTTLATATALTAADRGSRTLLLSTDAAHSLADVLLQPVDADPVPIAHNLDAVQLDARRELQRTWETIATYLRRLLGFGEIDRLRLDELVAVPGLDQLVALARLHTLVVEGGWDAIIVDCAPSADSLRFLTLPEVLHWYLERLFGRDGPVTRWGRRRIERTFSLPLPDDDVVASVTALSDELSQLRTLLSDATTSARVVVTPERVVIAEGQRTLAYLALYGYTVDAVLVNRVPCPEPASAMSGPEHPAQRAHLQVIDDVFAALPRLTVGLRAAEPLGIEPLREIGRELYGRLQPLARLTSTTALQISSAGDETVVRLFMPGANRADIDLEREGDELIVTLGPHRRTVKLPDGLNGRPVSRAGLNGQHLEVVFGRLADGR